MTITVYHFEAPTGTPDPYTTTSPAVAHQRGRMYGLRVYAVTAEVVGRALVGDYTTDQAAPVADHSQPLEV